MFVACLFDIADPRILSWWTETDLRTDSPHQSDAPLGLTWCSWLLTCAHTASSFFLHFWQGDSRKSQDLAWAACSVPRKSDQGATSSEFCWMQGPGIECGLSIGFDAFLLSFLTNRMLLFTVSLCLCPPGQNSGISNTRHTLA